MKTKRSVIYEITFVHILSVKNLMETESGVADIKVQHISIPVPGCAVCTQLQAGVSNTTREKMEMSRTSGSFTDSLFIIPRNITINISIKSI